MKKTENRNKIIVFLGILLLLQVLTAFYFGTKKTGFHYDEYYSYYSSNVTRGLLPTDREWKKGSEIREEFEVLKGEGFQYPTVVRMQTYDVHPPFYYLLLHTVCSLMPGSFSKWAGIGLNLFFFVISWVLLALLAWHLSDGKTGAVAGTCLLYGFNPAVLGGIMLVRMYMLLSVWVLLITWLHVKALKRRKRDWKFYLPVMAAVYLGFLTHYYFMVYLFFLAAAMEVYLLFETAEGKSRAQKWKDCIVYAVYVIGAMLLAVASYPACLGHIFRGYRGTEAMGAFFDMGNTAGRLRFFVGLLNEYVFGSLLPVLLLVLFLLALTGLAVKRMRKNRENVSLDTYRTILIPAAAVFGYFAVVTKTALLNAEEANRYQLPVYGLLLLLFVVALFLLAQKVCGPSAAVIVCSVMIAVLTAGEARGLLNGKVLFLYEEDADDIAFAAQNREVPTVYFYNGNLMWMIWDDSLELMQYDEIYFVNMDDVSSIEDEKIRNADRVFAYVARNDASGAALEALQAGMGNEACAEKIRELLYCDLYEIRTR